MKLDSKYFDRIRVKAGTKPEPLTPECAWEGCCEPGTHRAPRGRDQEGQYYFFCFEHVRQYNKSYNYFSGLADNDIQAFLKDSMTGHRPTWKMGANSSGGAQAQGEPAPGKRWSRHTHAYNMFRDGELPRRDGPRRRARPLEIKAMVTLGVRQDASGETIRLRYKALVKQYHPDANGGDRGSEDRLREVIQAYKLLKQAGFC